MHCAAQARITAVCHLARLRHCWITDISVLYLPLPTTLLYSSRNSPLFVWGPGQLWGFTLTLTLLFLEIQVNFLLSLLILGSVLLFQADVASLLTMYATDRRFWKAANSCYHWCRCMDLFPLCSMLFSPYFPWVLFHEQIVVLSVGNSWALNGHLNSQLFHLIHLQMKDITSVIPMNWKWERRQKIASFAVRVSWNTQCGQTLMGFCAYCCSSADLVLMLTFRSSF